MSAPRLRRFWQDAAIRAEPGGFAVTLDGRPIRTPARVALVLPTAALAEAVADEWNAQGETVDPQKMPLTRTANSALDTVIPAREAVVDLVAGYGETDLLCYRADGPDALRERQARGWDPLLVWARETFGADLVVTTGVMPAVQPPEAGERLRSAVEALDPFTLAGMHDLVSLSGSLVIGLATLHETERPAELWSLSRIDEAWQAEQWGRDAEAEREAARRRAAFEDAARFCRLSRA